MYVNLVCSSYSDYAVKCSWPVDPYVKLVGCDFVTSDKDVTIKVTTNISWDNGTLEDALPVPFLWVSLAVADPEI